MKTTLEEELDKLYLKEKKEDETKIENVGEVYRAGYSKAVRNFAEFDYCKVCEEKGQDEDCYYCRVSQAQEYIAEQLKIKSYETGKNNQRL